MEFGMRANAVQERCVDGGASAEIVWQPPIGQRVRVRRDLAHRCPEGAHDGGEAGHAGIVVNLRGARGSLSHPYLVLFDEPHPVMLVCDRPIGLPARHYAVEELESTTARA